MSEPSNANFSDAGKAVVKLLGSRAKKARFVTELRALMHQANVAAEEVERTLAQLEAENVIMIRDHFCADLHLAGVDLRIVALVESTEGVDPQMSAIREIDSAWDKWLAEYLANHRCG
jgi:hypothetical protein